MEARVRDALKACDRCGNYATLRTTFDSTMRPLLQQYLGAAITTTLRDHVSLDEVCPDAVQLRQVLEREPDDVWFLLFACIDYLLQSSSRKRGRGGENTVMSGLVTNVFVFLCQRGMPNLKLVTLRWRFLKKEKEKFESSDAYVNANASERRSLQLKSVLSVFSERAHKHHFTSVWLQCMQWASHEALHVHLLNILGGTILPHLTNPLVVADYLTGCFASGGLIAVLSLQGLLLLMMDHGFEYPEYYEQLYSLITPDSFASRHRYELFRLLDLSLSSLKIPAYVAASVVKRVACVSLSAPSPTLYFALPFIRKVLQTHPNCLALIHRGSREAAVEEADEADATAEQKKAKLEAQRLTAMLFHGEDPYDYAARMSDSRALNSTLWEFTALERHFLPVIPLMIASFSSTAEDKTPLRYEKNFARLFTAEVSKPLSKESIPSISYRDPVLDTGDAVRL